MAIGSMVSDHSAARTRPPRTLSRTTSLESAAIPGLLGTSDYETTDRSSALFGDSALGWAATRESLGDLAMTVRGWVGDAVEKEPCRTSVWEGLLELSPRA
jgi:hypothetical protein